jgi:hypothetical protein
VLAIAFASKSFEPIARRHPQIGKRLGVVNISKLTPRHVLDVRRELARYLAAKDSFGFTASEAQNHRRILSRHDTTSWKTGSPNHAPLFRCHDLLASVMPTSTIY